MGVVGSVYVQNRPVRNRPLETHNV